MSETRRPACLTLVVASMVLVSAAHVRAAVAPPESLQIEPAAVLTWDELVQRELYLRSVVAPGGPVVVPHMPPPPARPFLGLDSTAAPAEALGTVGVSPELSADSTRADGSCAGGIAEPVLGANFLAIFDNGTVIPPDTMGAAGPNHLMTMLNSEVAIQTKAGAGLSKVSLDTFWGSVAAQPFDPRLVYDSLSGRWIAVVDAEPQSHSSKVCLAVSDTSDPTGTWRFYALDADPANTLWADFPDVGVNSTWIAITNNMWTINSGNFSGAKMWVVDKTTALAGGPLTVTVLPVGFDVSGGASGFALRVCLTFDAAQPTLYLADNSGLTDPGDGRMLLRLSRITGTGPSPAWSVAPGSQFGSATGLFRAPNDFSWSQIDAAQLGDARRVATNDPGLLNAVFRNGRVWFAHSGGLPKGAVNRTAAFWYQVNPGAMPNPVVQSGVLDGGAGVHHYFPTISANCGDDACVGFSRSDATRFVQAVYATRLGTDAAGTMRPVRVLKLGAATYYKTFGGPSNRWGDYSATVVDPADDLTFWTIQEYAGQRVGPNDNDSRWGTWWGRLDPVLCTPPAITTQPGSQTVCAGGPATFTVGASGTAPLSYQWRKAGVDIPGATSSSYGLGTVGPGDAGSYDCVVTDACGSATSNAATLTVNAAPSITQQPADQTVTAGQPAGFSVVAAGTTPLGYQWYKGGAALTDGGAISGATTANLAISPASLTDAGNYDVIVTNGCGSATSASATLTVWQRGDLNCDGAVDFDDINPFVTALVSRANYEAAFPNCRWLNGDIDGNGTVDFDDINPFVACLVQNGCP